MDCDAIIVGGGPAGRACAGMLGRNDFSVSLIEKNVPGGTAVESGYFISKVILEALGEDSLHNFFQLNDLIEERSNQASEAWKQDLKEAGVDIIAGAAKITAPDEVKVREEGGVDRKLRGGNIVLASGSRPVSPLDLSLDEGERIITYENIMTGEWLDLDSIVIVGGDVEGCEFATLYENMGTKVFIVEQKSEILPNCDSEISRHVRKRYTARGIDVLTGSTVANFSENDEGVKVEVVFAEDRGNTREASQYMERGKNEDRLIQADALLVTGGKEPSLPEVSSRINLSTGKEGFIEVDENMRTSEPAILAAGDVIGGMASANAAIMEGKASAHSIMGEDVELDYLNTPYVFFSSPQVSGVGLREDDIDDDSEKYTVKRFDFSKNYRALSRGSFDGFCKLIVNRKNNTLLGAHFTGHDIEDLHGLATLAIRNNIPISEFKHLPLAHPTQGEVILQALKS